MKEDMALMQAIGALLEDANEQELRVVLRQVEKLMGEGLREHGAMDLLNDKRDLLGECVDEFGDAFTYLVMKLEQVRMIAEGEVSR